MSRKSNYKFLKFLGLFCLNLVVSYLILIQKIDSIEELETISQFMSIEVFTFISILVISTINIIIFPNVYKVILMLFKKKYDYIRLATYYLMLHIPSLIISNFFTGNIKQVIYLVVYAAVLAIIVKVIKEDYKFYLAIILGQVINMIIEIWMS